MKEPSSPGSLASRPDLREILGVSKERVRQLIETDPAFPAPEDILDGGRTPVWKRSKMQEYADARNTAHGRRRVEPSAA